MTAGQRQAVREAVDRHIRALLNEEREPRNSSDVVVCAAPECDRILPEWRYRSDARYCGVRCQETARTMREQEARHAELDRLIWLNHAAFERLVATST